MLLELPNSTVRVSKASAHGMGVVESFMTEESCKVSTPEVLFHMSFSEWSFILGRKFNLQVGSALAIFVAANVGCH